MRHEKIGFVWSPCLSVYHDCDFHERHTAFTTYLEFVAIDFESVSLQDGLRASKLDFSQPTFFSCLGVMVYLTREAVNAIFALVAGFPADSEIVFTFSTPDAAVS